MPTIQLIPTTATINGTKYTQLILTPVSPQHKQSKNILPKQEPLSPSSNGHSSEKKVEGQKGRIHFSKKALTHPRPQSITRRNTRERNRVRAVNQGFVTLANHVPSHLRSKKMSKVDTLKAAIDYIHRLKEALESNNPEEISDNDTQPEPSLSPSCSSPQSTSSTEASPTPVPHFSPITYQQNFSPVENASLLQTATTNLTQELAPTQYATPDLQHCQPDFYRSYVDSFPSDEHYYSYGQFHQTCNKEGFHIDYSRPQTMPEFPSPSNYSSSSPSSSSSQHHLSSDDAEFLEFASSWLC
ncbi:achaete-scute complex protein T3-like [Watersipora subatra]|uniref:achaete-scute complex protein T3-like n=1 Tax=Watersipora subatra TaxID=2589382 RepID=UPI00355AFE3B